MPPDPYAAPPMPWYGYVAIVLAGVGVLVLLAGALYVRGQKREGWGRVRRKR